MASDSRQRNLASGTASHSLWLGRILVGVWLSASALMGYACWLYPLSRDRTNWLNALSRHQTKMLLYPALSGCLRLALEGLSWIDRFASHEDRPRAYGRQGSPVPIWPTVILLAVLADSVRFWVASDGQSNSGWTIRPTAQRPAWMSILLYGAALLGMTLMLIGTVYVLDTLGYRSAGDLIRVMDRIARVTPGTALVSNILQARLSIAPTLLGPLVAFLMFWTKEFMFSVGFILWMGGMSLALPGGGLSPAMAT